MEVKCEKCGRKFGPEPNEHPGKVYAHHGEALCEECLIETGVLPDLIDPAHTRLLSEVAMYERFE